MSERNALRFIERVGGDVELQCRLRNVDPPDDLEEIVRIAAAAGFAFDVVELRAAFLTDWRLRRRYYAAVKVEPPPPPA